MMYVVENTGGNLSRHRRLVGAISSLSFLSLSLYIYSLLPLIAMKKKKSKFPTSLTLKLPKKKKRGERKRKGDKKYQELLNSSKIKKIHETKEHNESLESFRRRRRNPVVNKIQSLQPHKKPCSKLPRPSLVSGSRGGILFSFFPLSHAPFPGIRLIKRATT